MAKKYDGKAKKTHKITRDGLVETNAVTGEERRISQRGPDFSLKSDAPDQPALRPSANFKHTKQPRPTDNERPSYTALPKESDGRDADIPLDAPRDEQRHGHQIDMNQEGIVPPGSSSGGYGQRAGPHNEIQTDKEARAAKAANLRRQQRFHQAHNEDA